MELPTKKVKASRKSPKNMIIYGPPKIGKTTVLSQLEDCLIIDLEAGSDMVDALKIKVNNLKELADAGREIIKQKKPYKYIAIDTISKLEEWCEDEGKVAVKDLDLTGKIKQITCANADAVGYVYREGEETMISFDSMDDITAGSRCEHLKGQTIPLNWSSIFID